MGGKLFISSEGREEYFYNDVRQNEPGRHTSAHKTIIFDGRGFKNATVVHTDEVETRVLKLRCTPNLVSRPGWSEMLRKAAAAPMLMAPSLLEQALSFWYRPRGARHHHEALHERDADTGLYVGWVPGSAGAHSQGETLDELRANLQEVVEMLLEEGDPQLESVFVGTQTVEVA